ncbi:MAG: penicillin-binding protein [Sulfuricurvum sp. GWF2_44_89]|uniref:Penicillin-binding protein n=2 Tax=Sulfuricurvum TaxID=286130 RepID=A0A2D3WI79_9BACT|nr:MAG: penicillin-binding protein [Sulfuricurvum sp. GWF2_44_89]OHD90589.1 MAG: penicillin-binding protein [Sulfuricurvum sp. RIFOXYD12_FULL_44_77]OHD92577.1 MAG: penicillin-binding protein [Sulfuricurvum sp. RIFOXYD2_FULL_44_160]DAB37986.1 MAG TPA: penicillin-binding protein [Sulfuricurvum kujiense]
MRKYMLIGLGIIVMIPVVFLGYLIYSFEYETQKLIKYQPRLTTEVYDRNGNKIANLFSDEHRYYVSYENIPPRLIEALLAIEDTMFFEHGGVNPDAIMRAIIKDVSAGKLKEGASTITQQLVKNTLLNREKKFSRKFKEVLYAIRIEQELSKEQILERYFNEIYLGHGYYGIKTASDGYFRKPLKELTLKEIAMLVGLPKAPNFYSPTRNYELSLGRANRVIGRMYELGWIDQETYEKATQERPKVYNDTLSKNSGPYIIDEVMRQLGDAFPDIRSGGYKIYTTIDMRLQEAGYKALQSGRDEILKRAQEAGDLDENMQRQLNGALISLNPHTGEILAMVGGYDYALSPYNRVTQAKRQPGSAFKPFIYQVALDSGMSPSSMVPDIARTYTYAGDDGEEKSWQPKNYKNEYKGMVTIRDALTHSRNLATINMVSDMGFGKITDGLRRYGIVENLPPDLSIALGTISISPIDLAKYYTMFASGGALTNPMLVRQVITPKGETIQYENKSRQVNTPQQIYLMTSILKDVVSHGTGTGARVGGIEIAGKTGTTNKNVDAWFVGYSPTVETVVWFGHDNNTPMRRSETGGRAAGPVFRYYYEDMLRIYPNTKRYFDVPAGVYVGSSSDQNSSETFTDTSVAPDATQEEAPKTEEKLLF